MCALLGIMLGAGPFFGVFNLHHSHKAESTSVAPAAVERSISEAPAQRDVPPQTAAAEQSQPPASDPPAAAPADPAPAPPAEVPQDPPAPAPEEQPAPAPAPPASVLANNQVIVFYGSPGNAGMGILGVFPPEESAQRVKAEAAVYDSLNGDRGAVPALDLIYATVQAEPTSNGLYLRYLNDDVVRQYLDLAERYDTQLILDLQIGRGNVAEEVRKIEPYLRNPRVHVAIDPEYAVGPHGVPIETPGRISGADINEAQAYLSDLIARDGLPPKMLIIHQYLEDTVTDGGATQGVQNVDLVLNMDAFGGRQEKQEKYQMFSARPYAEHRSFNIFLRHDDHVLSEEEALALDPPPDVIFYQ